MATEDDIEWWEHADAAAMAAELAGDVAFLLAQAVEGHGAAIAAVPPGAAAVPLLETLFRMPVPWTKVTVLPTHGTLAAGTVEAAMGSGARVAGLDLPDPVSGQLDLAWLDVSDSGRVGGLVRGPDLKVALTSPHPVRAGADGVPYLTASALLGARALIISARGEGERAMLEEAITDGAGSRFPAGRLLAEADQAIDIHWCP